MDNLDYIQMDARVHGKRNRQTNGQADKQIDENQMDLYIEVVDNQ